MAEAYCGKSCADCSQRESLNCPGCKAGPGRQIGGNCDLAKCVRSKGHETCETCSFKGNCGTLRSRDHQPDYRKRRAEAELQQKRAAARRAPFLGKWLWILFWLVVPGTIAGLMTNEAVMEVGPSVYFTGQILSAVCSFAYGFILVKLSSEEDRYRTAGIFTLICTGVSLLAELAFNGAAWMLIMMIPAVIVGLVGEYQEYMAHSAVLGGIDNDLSAKWENLWKWQIGLFLGMFGCILLMLIIPVFGAIAVIGASIGLIVVGILKLVYLYKTAKAFRDYPVYTSYAS